MENRAERTDATESVQKEKEGKHGMRWFQKYEFAFINIPEIQVTGESLALAGSKPH